MKKRPSQAIHPNPPPARGEGRVGVIFLGVSCNDQVIYLLGQ